MLKETADAIHGWLSEPFDSKGSALNWIAFTALLVCGVFLWQLVLLSIIKGVEKL